MDWDLFISVVDIYGFICCGVLLAALWIIVLRRALIKEG